MTDKLTLLVVEECEDCAGSGCETCADTGRTLERKPTLSDLVEVIESLGGEVKETDTCKDAHVNCTTLEVNG